MVLTLMLGLLGVLLVLLFVRPIIDMCNINYPFVQRLKNTSWCQNYWLSGVFLFGINAILFFSTLLLFYILTFLDIPYLPLFILFFAVIISLFFWSVMNNIYQGTNKNRLKMATVGSSFYLILAILFVYLFFDIQPSYPGEDLFMKGMGILVGFIVTTVACITCFIFTALSKTKAV